MQVTEYVVCKTHIDYDTCILAGVCVHNNIPFCHRAKMCFSGLCFDNI